MRCLTWTHRDPVKMVSHFQMSKSKTNRIRSRPKKVRLIVTSTVPHGTNNFWIGAPVPVSEPVSSRMYFDAHGSYMCLGGYCYTQLSSFFKGKGSRGRDKT